MRKVTTLLGVASFIGVATLVLAGGSASAQSGCDFLTGGGYIIRDSRAKANFGVAGGCKGGSPTWGHLEYTDRGEGLQVKGTSITAYIFDTEAGTRLICGTARTNQFGDVDWFVFATDAGEPGRGSDVFSIQLSHGKTLLYTTFPDTVVTIGGGNIQLHEPNPSTSGSFSSDMATCPAFFAS